MQRWCDAITLPVDRRRAGVEARPYDVWGVGAQSHRCLLFGGRRTGDGAPYDVWESISVKPTSSVHQRKGRRGRRPLRWLRVGMFQHSREVQFDGTRCVPCRNVRFAVARRVHRPRCTVVARLPGQRWRGWPACPTAPTLPTVRPPRVYHPTYPIPRAQPAHHFYGRTHVIRPPTPGGRGSPPLRCVGKASASHPRRPQPLSHGAKRRDSSPCRGADRAGCGAPPLCISPASPSTPQSRRKAP